MEDCDCKKLASAEAELSRLSDYVRDNFINEVEPCQLVVDDVIVLLERYSKPSTKAEEAANSAVIALVIDKFQELAGKNIEAEFSVGKIIDTLEKIAQQPCPDGENNNERGEICPKCNKKAYVVRWFCPECSKNYEYGQYENPDKLTPVS